MKVYDGHVHYLVKKHIKKYKFKETAINIITPPLNHRDLVNIIKHQGIIKVNLFPLIFSLPPNYLEKLVRFINNEIYNVVSYYPHIFTGFLLLSDNIDKILLKNNLIKGVKLHFYMCNIAESIRKYKSIFSILENTGKFIILHEGSKEKSTPEKLLEKKLKTLNLIVSKYPKVRIIVAHSGRVKPFSYYGIEEFLDGLYNMGVPVNNLYFDTSTIRSLEGINVLIKKVGVEKIVFGSDYPYCKDKSEDVFKEEISIFNALEIEKKRAIFYENSQKLFFPEGWWVRRVLKEEDRLVELLLNLPPRERRFLAIHQKMEIISRWIKEEHTNIFILENFNRGICGYLRFSDRDGKGAFLEELVIFPEFRGLGYAEALLNKLKTKSNFIETKVLSKNQAMKNLLKKSDFIETKKGKRITVWVWKKKQEES